MSLLSISIRSTSDLEDESYNVAVSLVGSLSLCQRGFCRISAPSPIVIYACHDEKEARARSYLERRRVHTGKPTR